MFLTHFRTAVALIFVALLAACSPAVIAQPTTLPTATNVPATETIAPSATPSATATPEAIGPKPGQWQSESSPYITVSFTVSDDQKIRNLMVTIPMGSVSCNYQMSSIDIADDGTFEGSTSDFSVSGTFESESTMKGVFIQELCDGNMVISSDGSADTTFEAAYQGE
jgi:hypothetical protein